MRSMDTLYMIPSIPGIMLSTLPSSLAPPKCSIGIPEYFICALVYNALHQHRQHQVSGIR
jgi:hypothetical protein